MKPGSCQWFREVEVRCQHRASVVVGRDGDPFRVPGGWRTVGLLWHGGDGESAGRADQLRRRRRELAEVEVAVRIRLVTLTGIGGVGKTRLALRAAAELRRAFRDGVWLVQLDQLRDQALVAQAIAAALGLQDRAGSRRKRRWPITSRTGSCWWCWTTAST